MSHDPGEHDALMSELSQLAARSTGFDVAAIRPRAVERVLEQLLREGWTRRQVRTRAAAEHPRLVSALRNVVVVGETFFFRQPEHFELVSQHVHQRICDGATQIRAWSAGCATGEETYSLAATLMASIPRRKKAEIHVVGSDLLETNTTFAAKGVYATRSLRSAGPILYPTFRSVPAHQYEIDPSVQEVTEFVVHNLLDGPLPTPFGAFDVVFCRNVLVYFSRSAIRSACRNLAQSLAPGGVVVFGPMDLEEAPPGLERIGAPEHQLFRRRRERVREPERATPSSPAPAPLPATPARPAAAATPETPAEEPVALHVRALAYIERGDRAAAEALLSRLCETAPDYVPGLMERALLHVRTGERRAARALMERVLRLTEAMPPQRTLAGPEPLPVRFYTDSVRAFLERRGL